jgi:hypothetical protein
LQERSNGTTKARKVAASSTREAAGASPERSVMLSSIGKIIWFLVKLTVAMMVAAVVALLIVLAWVWLAGTSKPERQV